MARLDSALSTQTFIEAWFGARRLKQYYKFARFAILQNDTLKLTVWVFIAVGFYKKM